MNAMFGWGNSAGDPGEAPQAAGGSGCRPRPQRRGGEGGAATVRGPGPTKRAWVVMSDFVAM